MSWTCGECGVRLRDAETRCPACDVREIENLRAALAALTKEVEELRAGVGEARPAEPPDDAWTYTEENWGGVLAEEQPDARVAELEGLLDNERLYTAEHRGYAQVVGDENKHLREQLDAARDALLFYASCPAFESDLGTRARAALGDVAAARRPTGDLDSWIEETEDLGSALGQKAPESRGGES